MGVVVRRYIDNFPTPLVLALFWQHCYSKATLSWAKTIYYKYIVLAQLSAALL